MLPYQSGELPEDFTDRLVRLKEASGLTWSAFSQAIGADRKQVRRWRKEGRQALRGSLPLPRPLRGRHPRRHGDPPGREPPDDPLGRGDGELEPTHRAVGVIPVRPRRRPITRPGDMEDDTRRKARKRPARDGPEIRVVGIDVRPAPDAQARLRRLFTILAELAEDDPPPPGADPSPHDGGEEER